MPPIDRSTLALSRPGPEEGPRVVADLRAGEYAYTLPRALRRGPRGDTWIAAGFPIVDHPDDRAVLSVRRGYGGCEFSGAPAGWLPQQAADGEALLPAYRATIARRA